MAIQYVDSNTVSGWDGLANVLGQGIELKAQVGDTLQDLEANLQIYQGFVPVQNDLKKIQDLLANSPLANNPAFAAWKKKIQDTVDATTANYGVDLPGQFIPANGGDTPVTMGPFNNGGGIDIGTDPFSSSIIAAAQAQAQAALASQFASIPYSDRENMLDSFVNHQPYPITETVVVNGVSYQLVIQVNLHYNGIGPERMLVPDEQPTCSPAGGSVIVKQISGSATQVAQDPVIGGIYMELSQTGAGGVTPLKDFLDSF